jgi:two-component system CheB/CheR fusion protein
LKVLLTQVKRKTRFILPARGIALEIARLAASQELVFGTEFAPTSDGIEAILEVIRESLTVDFSQYKPNTLHRRIRRRMALHKTTTLEDYEALLQSNPKEVVALHQDILISVTNFFRDPESFSALKKIATAL